MSRYAPIVSGPEVGPRRIEPWQRSILLWYRVAVLVLGAALVGIAVWEARTGAIQARVFSAQAGKLTYDVRPGPSPAIRFPTAGPYDNRLGYSRLPRFLERLRAAGFEIESQARFSRGLTHAMDRGLSPPYREKLQAGLRILDRHDTALYEALYPARIYARFGSIPEPVVSTILFIENRELLDLRQPKRNPAVEWDRLAMAAYQYLHGSGDPEARGAGGSTLATQLEKARHSPGGLTRSAGEKIRQMLSASLRAYLDGEVTLETRKRIIVDYLNSLPLAASPGRGEIIGLAAGLDAWYGARFEAANHLIRFAEASETRVVSAASARAYKQVLSLLLAQRRPTYYLIRDRHALVSLTDAYLRLLAEAGVITPALRDKALAETLEFQTGPAGSPAIRDQAPRPAAVMRARLAQDLGLSNLYELDRLDLSVQSTLDRVAQDSATKALRDLRESTLAKAAGLDGPHLLDRGDPAGVVYSFSLYERGEGVNRLRVQTSSLGQPFSISEGAKLDLGSTAKLRTVVTYLEIMAELYDRHAGRAPAGRGGGEAIPGDRLTRWAVGHLADAPQSTLREMLEAALERRYAATPALRFYTGGGLHSFRNFDSKNDDRWPSVREAFRDSTNLVFVRLMRDIVQYYRHRLDGYSPAIFEDRRNPQRQAYLRRFADREGRTFLEQFYEKYRDQNSDEVLETLLRSVKAKPRRLAAVLRYVDPEASLDAFATALKGRLPRKRLSEQRVRDLFESLSLEQYDLADRGYIAGLHPLELWLAGFLRHQPGASLAEAIAAGPDARVEAYRWLFKTRNKQAQDRRIRTLLEIDVFRRIHQAWRRHGYPFDSLVPSYATALGSSADRPAALAELMGIIVNDGIRYPTQRIRRVLFAGKTPYETVVVPNRPKGERVFPAAVAGVLRALLAETVEEGTAMRARGVLRHQDGRPVTVGGKTGTGDHRYKTYGRDAQLLTDRAVNRAATFAFLIGDRFYGVVTAHVTGAEAADYSFTSSLPVQLFVSLAPILRPLIEQAESEPRTAPPLQEATPGDALQGPAG
jgi:membrane peptidoglycan carboxypeptidase